MPLFAVICRDKPGRLDARLTTREAHLETLGQAVAGMALVTGGSGLGWGIARAISGGAVADPDAAGAPLAGPAVVLSGSCSVMTNRQVAAYRAMAPAREVEVERCLADARGEISVPETDLFAGIDPDARTTSPRKA